MIIMDIQIYYKIMLISIYRNLKKKNAINQMDVYSVTECFVQHQNTTELISLTGLGLSGITGHCRDIVVSF